jgi:hypothetical protein
LRLADVVGVMITATTSDLNEVEFVSRDVERSGKKHVGSVGWIGCTMKQGDCWGVKRSAQSIAESRREETNQLSTTLAASQRTPAIISSCRAACLP